MTRNENGDEIFVLRKNWTWAVWLGASAAVNLFYASSDTAINALTSLAGIAGSVAALCAILNIGIIAIVLPHRLLRMSDESAQEHQS